MDQAEYFRRHPPRCIAGFTTRPTELPGTESDGHVSMSQLAFDVPPGVTIDGPELINPSFALSCPCGGSRHYVHGYRWVNPDLQCECVPQPARPGMCSVRKNDRLIPTCTDTMRSWGTATVRGERERVVFECPSCGRQPVGCSLRTGYANRWHERRTL
jgi:hypothetical protein